MLKVRIPRIRVVLVSVRAELEGGATCSAMSFVQRGGSPVLALCRKPVEAGQDPLSRRVSRAARR